ncbi:PAS domain S-box protein [Sphingomonas sp. H39-1-10]|uniref:PAS domain S-box protein n=1 Tax=Sphingomonas pollutisoli TaxID=3030829 RepID=UPI0023B8EE89|nr:PAS domain S-box protein [Sphingomonas pollutisoli]MDF0488342.1 PAS domain S-box protein [Sphingomonas pollutisoli]
MSQTSIRQDRVSEDDDLTRLLLEHAPAAIAVLDTDMRYLRVSRRWLTDYNLSESSIEGKSHYELFPEIGEDWRAVHGRALHGETVSSDIERFDRADGATDWVRWEVMPWRRPGGEIGGIVLFTEVLTGLVRSQTRAAALNRELNLLIDSAERHALCFLDRRGRVIIWNAGAQRLYGWSEVEALGREHSFLFLPSDRMTGLPATQLRTALEEGSCHSRSARLRKDGTQFLADATVNAVRDAAGNAIGFGSVVHDMTPDWERMQAAEARVAQLRSILDTVPDAMVTADEKGDVLSFSPAAQQMFGYTADEVLGRSISMLMSPDDALKHNRGIERYGADPARGPLTGPREVQGRRKTGEVFSLRLFVGEATAGGSKILTGFMRDLTAAERVEAERRTLQTQLLRISRITTAGTMATTLAHELNQPLNAIANYLQAAATLVGEERADACALVGEALEEAGREALRAGAIVHGLREFVRREELDRTIEDPHDVTAQAMILGAVDCKVKGISCTSSVPRTMPRILVDRVQIQQALMNLIRNAIDVLGRGGVIDVGARVDRDMVQFTVTDNGPGISAEAAARLFKPFLSDKAEGMGLGLSICRSVVEAHGGRIWYETEEGKGSCFHFTVPSADA